MYMKNTTRLLSLVLVVCMLLGMIPAVSASTAAQTVTPEAVEPDYFTSTDWIWSSTSVSKNSVSYFRNDYELKAVPTALDVRVSAHNHVKFYVNGNIITGYVSPAPTAVPENIYYLTYSYTGEELTALVSGKELALAAAVQYMGNQGMNYVAGQPGLWAEVTVTYGDGSKEVLVTGTDWEALGTGANPYKGGTPNMSSRQMNAQIDYDAQKMPDPLAWTKYGYAAEGWVSAVDAPALTDTYKLRVQPIPEGRIHEEITPVAVERQKVGHQVFDVGRIATGWVKLTASAPAGTRICIRYSEDLTGSAGDRYVRHNVANEGSETYCDYYTFSGNGVETFIADFDYKAFRYFEVVGLPELITAENVTMQWASTGVDYTADFSSSDEMLNKIYQASINTQINNLEGMPVDCPHREQSQYLADSQLQYYLLSYAFSDFAGVNYKTMLDFAAQQFASGRFTFVAPSQMYASGNSIPEWDLRYSNMLYNYYWVTGDVEGMSYFYDDAAENVNYYLKYVDATGLLPDIAGWNISDHPEKQACGDDPGKAPTVCNILLYDSLNHLSKIATLLGKDEDAAVWASKAVALRAAINSNLLNHETGMYYKHYGTTATNEGITAMAINLGVAEPNQLEQQMNAIAVKGLASTSVVLTYEVFRCVMENGTAAQKESVYERIIRTWGPMMNAGDSTCWEGFRDENSHSHAWNAYPARIMLEYMSGITYTDVNYTGIEVKPWLPEAVDNVEGTFTVPGDRGKVVSRLTRNDDGSYELDLNNRSEEAITVAVPRVAGNSVITEGNEGTIFANGVGAAAGSLKFNDVTYIGNDAEYVYVTANPGYNYHFTSTVAAGATEGEYTVTVNGTEGGKVLVNGTEATLPYTATVAAGTQIAVEAVAGKGAAFTGWSGTYGSVEETLSFTVGGNVTLTANFEAREGTVYNTVTVDGPADSGLKVNVNGASFAIPARVAMVAGQELKVSIVEPEKRTHNFVAWAGDVFSGQKTLTFDGTDDVDLEVIASYAGSTVSNLALGKKATTNNTLESAPQWTMANLTDGKTFGVNPDPIGATSKAYSSGDLSANPHVLTLDLEKVSNFDVIKLYPRADVTSKNGGVPCYPSTFTVAVSANGSTYTDVATVTDYAAKRNSDNTVDPIVVSFGEQEARYIRITTTKVANPDDHGASYYVQLHEMEVFLEGNLAQGKKATFNHQLVSAPLWTMENLTDGKTYGKNPGAIGATSGSYPSGDLSANPNILTLDLDKATKFNLVKLYPRADEVSADGGVPCYPSTFTISVSTDGSTYSDVASVKDYVAVKNADGSVDPIVVEFPEQEARYIRMTTTKANGADNHGTCYVQLHEMVVQNTGAAGDADAVLNIKGTGSVLINGEAHDLPYTGGYAAGTDLAILAVAAEGSRFTGWTGDAGSSKRPMMYVTMGNNINLNANFTSVMVGKSENLALNGPVAVPEGKFEGAAAQWSVAHLTDGILESTGADAKTGKKGITSISYASPQLTDESLYVDIDMGKDVDFNQLILWPRTDVYGAGGAPESPNFPVAFKVQYRLDGDSVWRDIKTFTDVENPNGSAGVFDLGLQNGRYIRIIPITLGSPAADDASGAKPYRFQLVEAEVYADEVLTDNLGVDATITTNDSGSNAGAWSTANLVDGQVRSAGRGSEEGTKGFTSNGYGPVDEVGNDISSNPHWIEYKWDDELDVNQVILYPRSDLDGDTANSGLAANFPYDFHIDAKVNGVWKTVYSATGVNNGLSPVICDFETVTTDTLRLITTKLGVCASDETSRTQRIQLAEMKVGNIIRGEYTEGSVSITANGEEELVTSLGQLTQLMAEVEAATFGGEGLYWSIEDEQGFVADIASLTDAKGDAPVFNALAEGSAYVVARFSNGLATHDKLLFTINESNPAADAAAAVDAKIDAIGEVTLDSKADIDEARAAYDALSDEAKALVTKLDALTAAEARYAELVAAAEQEAIEKAAADVDAKIEAIGKVTLNSKAAIDEARAAYDALSDESKALVTKLDVLVAAEADYAVLTCEVSLKVTGGEDITVADEKVSFTVSAEGAEKLATLTLKLTYDQNTMTDVKLTPAEGWAFLVQTVENGEIKVIVYTLTGLTGTGDLFTVEAATTGATGEATVAVTEARLSAFIGEGETYVAVNLDDASASVKVDYNIYDVNRDGVVNQLDITRGQRWFGTDNAICDVDDSGEVDIADLILIANNYTK